jgi:hypothetical protein
VFEAAEISRLSRLGLGVDGVLAVDGGNEVDIDGVLDAGETYFYATDINKATGVFFLKCRCYPVWTRNVDALQ